MAGLLLAVASAMPIAAHAQGTPPAPLAGPEAGMQPGEAFVTRFSGTTPGANPVIDLAGRVGSIIDVRNPGQPPQGAHWIDEPQRAFITAGEVGQVFGVALDDATPPNIYVAATSAFGLHLAPGGGAWMQGMWGPGGGPGTIYILDAASGYKPRVFANVTLDGRPNSGAGLGNITYDRYTRQLLVSDLETGMIHRIRTSDGAELGRFDHGTQGRAAFTDAQTGQAGGLPPIAFDPSSTARVANCTEGPFERTPSCWNFAPSGRRVWGVGVWRHPQSGTVRLYYAVWSGPAFNNRGWAGAAEDDKRVAVWSVGLDASGAFEQGSVRREFELPDFFVSAADVARAGFSHPVSDIAFSQCSERPVMIVAERGGIRNLGLAAEDAFATPHEARALRYELDQSGVWRPVGRYDVGFYDRKDNGPPFVRANCAGGADFGIGFDPATGAPQAGQPDGSVWITGDYLCSPKAPCNMPGMGEAVAGQEGGEGAQPAAAAPEAAKGGPDDSHVHGTQGMRAEDLSELLPQAAQGAYPQEGEATPSGIMDRTYLIDTDINIDETGGLVEQELLRNDATRIGDIAIYQPCAARPVGTAIPAAALLPPPTTALIPPALVGHPTDISHARVASHGTATSHHRYGSHNPYWSHNRWRSHNRDWSHSRDESHDVYLSHNRWSSHRRQESHSRLRSHSRSYSHWQIASHNRRWSHSRFKSHSQALSHGQRASHNHRISHARLRSHNLSLSHTRLRSHARSLSHSQTSTHTSRLSHSSSRSHSTALSHTRAGSHLRSRSHGVSGSHSSAVSHGRTASHSRASSGGQTHLLSRSHARAGSGGHTTGGHNALISARTNKGGHNAVISARTHTKGPVSGFTKGGVHQRGRSLGTVPTPHTLKSTPHVRTLPTVRNPPHVRTTPTVRPTPHVRTLPAVRNTPRVRPTPQVRTTPRVRTLPTVRNTPRIRQTPRVRQTPQIRQTPRVRTAPRVRQVPRVRNAPRVRQAPRQLPRARPAPRVRQAPVQRRKR